MHNFTTVPFDIDLTYQPDTNLSTSGMSVTLRLRAAICVTAVLVTNTGDCAILCRREALGVIPPFECGFTKLGCSRLTI
jgi:hypothetical protein